MATVDPDLIRVQHGLYRRAADSQRPVNDLFGILTGPVNLQAAWERVQKADGAETPGPDGVTCSDVAPWHRRFLLDLAQELDAEQYQPSPPRYVDVAKAPGGIRRLGILNIRDRVVHAALKQVLEPVLEPAFWDRSFGFRPGHSVYHALAAVARAVAPAGQTKPCYPYALRLDVVKCFDRMDHDLMIRQLTARVADPRLIWLIQRILAAGGGWTGRWFRRRPIGLVQGSALSPLLCNLYLDPLDRVLQQAECRRRVCGFRYADDLLVLAQTRRDARYAARRLRSAAGELQLRLGAKGLRIARVARGVSWLGAEIQFPHGAVRPLIRIPQRKIGEMLDKLDRLTRPDALNVPEQVLRIDELLRAVNEKLNRWRLAYYWADNAAEVFALLDQRVHGNVRWLLQRCTGLKGARLRQDHFVPLPRGFGTWQFGGVRLVNLSAQPPTRPREYPRQPEWRAPIHGQPRGRPRSRRTA